MPGGKSEGLISIHQQEPRIEHREETLMLAEWGVGQEGLRLPPTSPSRLASTPGPCCCEVWRSDHIPPSSPSKLSFVKVCTSQGTLWDTWWRKSRLSQDPHHRVVGVLEINLYTWEACPQISVFWCFSDQPLSAGISAVWEASPLPPCPGLSHFWFSCCHLWGSPTGLYLHRVTVATPRAIGSSQLSIKADGVDGEQDRLCPSPPRDLGLRIAW